MAVIAFIGLGHMGAPMAGRLVRAGHVVRGFDVSARGRDHAETSYGVTVCSSQAEALDGTEAVLTMVPKGEHARQVFLDAGGVLGHVAPGTVLVDCSTIDMETALDLHRAAQDAGCPFVDAPVSGGTIGAQEGTLTAMCGGLPDSIAAAEPYLRPMTAKIVSVGGPGTGQAAKMINNMLLFINLAGVAEGVALAERLGVDLTVLHDIISASSGDSWPLRKWFPVPGVVETAPVNEDFEASFPAEGAVKDVRLAVSAADRLGLPLSIARKAEEMYQALIDAGYGDLDCSAVVKVANGTVSLSASPQN